MSTPVLIDTDPGIDDALALLLALGSPEISVEAISTVAGNVPVEHATANVFRLLAAVRPRRPPRVAQGAGAPLRQPLVSAGHVHGEDGLGNVDRLLGPEGGPRYPSPPPELAPGDGADLLLQAASRFPGELVVVALGPLTNLAIALERDRQALTRVARLVVMGGAVGVPGNVAPAAEFNFYVDPEAAAAVLRAGLPLELVPLDVTRQVVLRAADLDARLASCASPLARFVADFTRHGFAAGARHGEAGLILHDPLAVGVAIDPSLVALEALQVEVECEGRLTRGLSLADRRPVSARPKGEPNCRVATSVDAQRFLALFLDRLCPASA